MHAYNIPLNADFLKTLANFVSQNSNVNDIILLPTNRACKTLQRLLLKNNMNKNVLLPKILPIDSVPKSFASYLNFQNKSNLKPITITHKIFLLNLLVGRANPTLKFSSTFALAIELCNLMDNATREMISWEKLQQLDTDNFSAFAKENTEFLSIISKYYPDILNTENLIDNEQEKINLFQDFIELLNNKTEGKIILAGSTASMVQTQKLIKTLSQKDNFYLFLPSFDEAYFGTDFLPQTHPQFSMLNLINNLNLKSFLPLDAVIISNEEKTKLAHAINKTVDQTATWINENFTQNSTQNLKLIQAYDIEQEAQCIGYEIYQSYLNNETVCVVCENKNLTKKISQILTLSNIPHDLSFPISYDKSTLGQVFNLLLDFTATDSPLSFINCIKNQYFINKDTTKTEFLLRIKSVLSLSKDYKRFDKKYDTEIDLINQFLTVLQPLKDALLQKEIPFNELFKINIEVIEKLYPQIFQDTLNQQGLEFIEQLKQESWIINPQNYSTILNEFLKLQTVRKIQKEEFCTILGTIDARLFNADKFIITSLNENSFPKEKDDDPFLNQNIRASLQLPSLKRKIGLQAHDFAQFLCKKSVIFTRSKKVLGNPQIKSRFLEKLETILKLSNLEIPNFDKYNDILNSFIPREFDKISPPSFTPKNNGNISVMSVTDLENLLKDPYGIYAKKILKLKKLDDFNDQKIFAEFGNIVHNGLEEFAKNKHWNKDDLINEFKRLLSLTNISLAVSTFFASRFVAIANQAIQMEAEFGAHIPLPEKIGEFEIIPNFSIKAKVDRINIYPNNTYDIMDYKTGTPPSKTDIINGKKLQLTIANMIAKSHGFSQLQGNEDLNTISYIKINGKVFEKTTLSANDVEKWENESLPKLKNLLTLYQLHNKPYVAKKLTDRDYSDYKYLSRQREWNYGE